MFQILAALMLPISRTGRALPDKGARRSTGLIPCAWRAPSPGDITIPMHPVSTPPTGGRQYPAWHFNPPE